VIEEQYSSVGCVRRMTFGDHSSKGTLPKRGTDHHVAELELH
jgi:hypothetical protein